jgi:hypothetical protein
LCVVRGVGIGCCCLGIEERKYERVVARQCYLFINYTL